MLGASATSLLVALEVKGRLAAPPLPLMLMTAGIFATTYLGILAVRGLFDTETMLATTKRIRLLLGWSAKAP